MSYFDNSNGQPTITHGGPGALGGGGAQSFFDSTNSSGNQLVYVPDPAWIGGNYSQYGWMFNWTGTGLELECEATTPVNQQYNTPAGGWNNTTGGASVINPIPCSEGDSISLYDASGNLACQFTVPTFNKASTSGGGGSGSGSGSSGGQSGSGGQQPSVPSTSKKVFQNFW